LDVHDAMNCCCIIIKIARQFGWQIFGSKHHSSMAVSTAKVQMHLGTNLTTFQLIQSAT
jgi:hypothetical protein